MPRARSSRSRANSSSTRIGDSPIEGSSISISLGSSISPRAISSIFCSPPESVEAWALALRRSTGKRVHRRLHAALEVEASRRRDAAELEIVQHGELGKDVAPLRHVADAVSDQLGAASSW